ncbi:enterochelin esterase-like enzyme [Chthonomonas calidirosea]|uniref:Enterochelin esterase and related enzymes n=1 Tax=Chthonomonas calidirosea (strain DSM 23976 / ICMP 18418 / T49) TaxID=1303518 RepID=S0ESW2_CHTCT|nr:alpha/beta hydrolase-fold protein [Chthonomonas calidirosea]CCW34095.1 Enterochelin esterase and related enzymes [Chthonomonas calidirosea T49]CEK14626.1 enterochelin esterase-like enzyme [Chthonomonas calidirosea]CEK15771.1 enterochelin esterase-like enzyme [Chthonomonas calidirosea]
MKKSVLSYILLGLMAVLLEGLLSTAYADDLTPLILKQRLADHPTGAMADQLADQVRSWFGRTEIKDGAPPRVDGLTTAWAIEAPDATMPPKVLSDTGQYTIPLQRIGQTPVYVAVVDLPNGAGMIWTYEVNGRRARSGNLEVYAREPETNYDTHVAHGKLIQMPDWHSNIFAGTVRSWWIYVPAEYTPEHPACVMVFQDGGYYKNFVPTVFDNLIGKREMPVTVGIFIDPGHFPDNRRSPGEERSFEYDTLSDQYARFLLEEILPAAERVVKLREDAASRAVAGISSGGICAFTVAWSRPDQFSKVMSWVGSFTDLAAGKTLVEGGHNYPFLIRRLPPKPIRVFLQDGSHDLDNIAGNWPLCNQQMARALAFKGYDYKFVFGEGFHSGAQGEAILPSTLRWLWRDYPMTP